MDFKADTPGFGPSAPLVPIVLVHGAWHSPVVWEPVTELLRERGHHVTVPELPIDSPKAIGDDHADLIAEACGGGEAPVVVAHTSGSLTALLVPERVPVRQMIHVNGLLPKIGESFNDQVRGGEFDFGEDSGRLYDRDACSFWNNEEKFRALLAHDCDEMTQARLWSQLRRQARGPLTEVTPLKQWPETPTSAILYSNDADLPIEWLRRTTLDRLGVEAWELPGSQLGFNARPRLFVKTLTKLIAMVPRSNGVSLRRAS
ncbi:MAG: alpha/beta fold hydrolase [Solirubrobacterales bacterium]